MNFTHTKLELTVRSAIQVRLLIWLITYDYIPFSTDWWTLGHIINLNILNTDLKYSIGTIFTREGQDLNVLSIPTTSALGFLNAVSQDSTRENPP